MDQAAAQAEQQSKCHIRSFFCYNVRGVGHHDSACRCRCDIDMFGARTDTSDQLYGVWETRDEFRIQAVTAPRAQYSGPLTA